MKNGKSITDLDAFHKAYDMIARKRSPELNEYRVRNLDQEMTRARRIISANSLKLDVRTTGAMAQIRAFEVVPRKEADNG